MKYILQIVILFGGIFIIGCSSASETTTNTGQDSSKVYSFDVVEDDSLNQNMSVKDALVSTSDSIQEARFFIVQLGAFTTEDRAKRFIEEAAPKLNYELSYHLSEAVNLFVVQLPPFKTREEAETVRNKLWLIDKFKDAFIVPQF